MVIIIASRTLTPAITSSNVGGTYIILSLSLSVSPSPPPPFFGGGVGGFIQLLQNLHLRKCAIFLIFFFSLCTCLCVNTQMMHFHSSELLAKAGTLLFIRMKLLSVQHGLKERGTACACVDANEMRPTPFPAASCQNTDTCTLWFHPPPPLPFTIP